MSFGIMHRFPGGTQEQYENSIKVVHPDGGNKWTNLTDKMLEKKVIPGPRWVATIEPSRFKEGRCYVCYDAHRSNDDKPYVYVTEDFGTTWKPMMGTLPAFGSSRCLREDVQNQNLLFCGTEFGVYASINRGGHWTRRDGVHDPGN